MIILFFVLLFGVIAFLALEKYVFSIFFFCVLMIYCFKIIPVLEKRGRNNVKNNMEEETNVDNYEEESCITAFFVEEDSSNISDITSSFDNKEETDNFIDDNGLEHTVDYDGYCDECDNYHEE